MGIDKSTLEKTRRTRHVASRWEKATGAIMCCWGCGAKRQRRLKGLSGWSLRAQKVCGDEVVGKRLGETKKGNKKGFP